MSANEYSRYSFTIHLGKLFKTIATFLYSYSIAENCTYKKKNLGTSNFCQGVELAIVF